MPLLGRLLSRSLIIYSRHSAIQFSASQSKTRFFYSAKIPFVKYSHRTYAHDSHSNLEATSTDAQKGSGSDSSSSSSSSSNSDENDENEGLNAEQQLQFSILEAALPFVKEYGWTTDAIAKGAETLGYSSMVHGMFHKGEIDLVNHFYAQCNSRLENELLNMVNVQKTEEKKMTTTEFIRAAVEMRLRMNADYIDTWAKALVIHASPSNLASSFNNNGILVDTIWYHAGDRSTDFNWYTKRGLLLGVYKSTELCMLQDNSENFQDTWAFLDRRLNEVKTGVNCVKQAKQRTEDASLFLEVGLITVQNILGLNTKRRH